LIAPRGILPTNFKEIRIERSRLGKF